MKQLITLTAGIVIGAATSLLIGAPGSGSAPVPMTLMDSGANSPYSFWGQIAAGYDESKGEWLAIGYVDREPMATDECREKMKNPMTQRDANFQIEYCIPMDSQTEGYRTFPLTMVTRRLTAKSR
jgi:hypothetical protein